MSFTNVSILLESWFTIYPFLAPRIADTTILYSQKVLKTFNLYFNHKHKFTIITGKIRHDRFDSIYESSILFLHCLLLVSTAVKYFKDDIFAAKCATKIEILIDLVCVHTYMFSIY